MERLEERTSLPAGTAQERSRSRTTPRGPVGDATRAAGSVRLLPGPGPALPRPPPARPEPVVARPRPRTKLAAVTGPCPPNSPPPMLETLPASSTSSAGPCPPNFPPPHPWLFPAPPALALAPALALPPPPLEPAYPPPPKAHAARDPVRISAELANDRGEGELVLIYRPKARGAALAEAGETGASGSAGEPPRNQNQRLENFRTALAAGRAFGEGRRAPGPVQVGQHCLDRRCRAPLRVNTV